jgi:hypothetical protein
MNTSLLRSYIRLYNWIVQKLEDIVTYPEDYILASELRELQKLYFTGRGKTEIVDAFLQKYPHINPELANLVFDKLASQDGGLSYMDRFLATLF